MCYYKVVGSILLIFSLGNASLVVQAGEAQATVLIDAYSIQDVLFRVQDQFVALLPSDKIYQHHDKTLYAVEWEDMSKKLKKRMHATMIHGFPIYELRLITDPISRDTIFYNSRDMEVYRISQPADSYDPYAWWKNKLDVSSYSEIDEWNLWIFDYAHTGVSIQMIPASLQADFMEELAYQESQEQLMQSVELAFAPISMMMSMESEPELQISISSLSNGTVEILVEWLGSLDSDSLDLFHATDLVAANWQLETNFPTASSTNFYFSDQDTNQTSRFYVTGTDYDGDLDGLTSARERYLYKTREDLFSTDGDGLGDGWELGYGFDPFSTTGTNGALGDADNDGYGNLEEQLNDTGPHDPDGNSITGTVATIRYYYDEDDRLTDFYSGAEVAQKTILTAAHNISEEVSAK